MEILWPHHNFMRIMFTNGHMNPGFAVAQTISWPPQLILAVLSAERGNGTQSTS